MRTAFALVAVGFVAMVAALVYGFALGDGWNEVSVLVGYPWFNVSLVDVYVGFGLVAGWIWWREGRHAVAAAWIVAILLLGNAISCLYVLLALAAARGDARAFWLGARTA